MKKITQCPYAGPEIMKYGGQWAKFPGQKSIKTKQICWDCEEVFVQQYKGQEYCDKCKAKYHKKVAELKKGV